MQNLYSSPGVFLKDLLTIHRILITGQLRMQIWLNFQYSELRSIEDSTTFDICRCTRDITACREKWRGALVSLRAQYLKHVTQWLVSNLSRPRLLLLLVYFVLLSFVSLASERIEGRWSEDFSREGIIPLSSCARVESRARECVFASHIFARYAFTWMWLYEMHI